MPTNTTRKSGHHREHVQAGPIGPADEALLATEQEIAALRRRAADLTAAGDRSEHDEIWNRVYALDSYIWATASESLIGAAVKLRRLADEQIGIEAGGGRDEIRKSVCQVLAIVEGLIAPVHPADRAETSAAQPAREIASIGALIEKRFRLVEETEKSIHGLGHDDETTGRIVDGMTEAMSALDQAIVDRVPASVDEIMAQLRLYRDLGDGGFEDDRDERLFKSMLAGLAGLRHATQGGAA